MGKDEIKELEAPLENPIEEEEEGVALLNYDTEEDIVAVDTVLKDLTSAGNALLDNFSNLAKSMKASNTKQGTGLLLGIAEQLQTNATARLGAIKARNSFRKTATEISIKKRQLSNEENRDADNVAFSSEMLKMIQDAIMGGTSGASISEPETDPKQHDENSESLADNIIEQRTSEDTTKDGDPSKEIIASMSGRLYLFNPATNEISPYFFEDSEEQICLDVEIDEVANEYVVYLDDRRITVYEIDEEEATEES